MLLARYERWVQKTPVATYSFFRNRGFTMSFLTHMMLAPMSVPCSSVLALFSQVSLGLSTTVSSTLAMPKNLLLCILPSLYRCMDRQGPEQTLPHRGRTAAGQW